MSRTAIFDYTKTPLKLVYDGVSYNCTFSYFIFNKQICTIKLDDGSTYGKVDKVLRRSIFDTLSGLRYEVILGDYSLLSINPDYSSG